MKKVRSVSRAVRILEAFSEESAVTVSELARSLQYPKSSVYEILSTLADEGLIEKDGDSNLYRLGLKIIELAYSARHNLEVSRVAQPLLRELNKSLDETVLLTVLDRDEVLYIDGYESSKQLRTFFQLGDRAPLYCTALGKAILAYLPPQEVDRILTYKGLQRLTLNTLADRRKLLEDLRLTVERGYSIDNMEHEEAVRCVGAPIHDREGRVFASISVSAPTHRLTPAQDAEIARLVVATAKEISRRLGYRPEKADQSRR